MKKIIIIGAGEGGKLLIREIINSQKDLKIIGLLDDAPELKNTEILGIKILGSVQDLKKIASEIKIDEVFIAIPSLRGKKLTRIVDTIQQLGLRFHVLPGIFESLEYLTTTKVPVGNLRKVELKDLLDRAEVSIDIKDTSNYLGNKTILIMGAGGSIGSELARRVAEFNPSKLILADIYENNLYELQMELSLSNVECLIVDMKDKNHLDKIFANYRPEVIFHAAAHKHVPLMEKNPQEAVKNNILGSANMIDLAVKYQVEKFVFISTDKAVSPTSIMGVTKRFTEEQILSLNSKKPIFAIVRFGNVLGSYGSVIPLWQKQLLSGQPLTVTHSEMERFFMTIPEAAQLVIQTGAMAKGSEIFVLKMGKQYKIIDLANDFIKLAGFVPGKNAKITITGLRPGEKLSETLNEKNEILAPSGHPMIARIQPVKKNRFQIKSVLENLKNSIGSLSNMEVTDLLKRAIPEFTPYAELIKPKIKNETINFSSPALGQEEISAVTEVLKSGWLTMGPKVLEFEKEFAKFHNKKFALSCSSATAGLHLSLLSLNVGPGDEVIVPSYTFASCANTIVWTGAKPVFCDIHKEGLLINPAEIEKKITPKTKALVIVHYGGQMADMNEVLKIAKKYNLFVIEDCAHSPGAKYEGKLAGTIGDLGVFSFYPTKNIASAEGGMIITDNPKLAEKIKILRLHGMTSDAFNRYSEGGKWAYQITEAGFKYNMTDLQAAIGLVQFRKLKLNNQKRAKIATMYQEKLKGVSDLESLPQTLPERENVWHLYPVLVSPWKRNLLIKNLKDYNIISSVHFIPIHMQPYYQKKFGYQKGDLPVSEWVFEREISLPMHPALEKDDINYIHDVLKFLLTIN